MVYLQLISNSVGDEARPQVDNTQLVKSVPYLRIGGIRLGRRDLIRELVKFFGNLAQCFLQVLLDGSIRQQPRMLGLRTIIR